MTWKLRTKSLLAERNMSQSELADKLGITRSSMSLWLGDNVDYTEQNTKKMQYKVAKILRVTQGYLETGIHEILPNGRAVPLLHKDQVSQWLGPETFEPEAWFWCPKHCSENSYALMTDDNSNFETASLVYIDPEQSQVAGEVCVFRDRNIVMGRYQNLNGQETLIFLNPQYPSLILESAEFLGVVIGVFFDPSSK